MNWRRTLRFLFECFYPPRCVLCGNLLPWKKNIREVCLQCRGEMPWIRGATCAKCGIALEEEFTLCPRCEQQEFAFQQARCVFPYVKVRHVIFHFKFSEYPRDAVPLAKLMYEYQQLFVPHFMDEVDFFIPVPMHFRKQRRRGFNQSELLAKQLGKLLQIPCESSCLVRSRETTPQNQLSASERKKNLQNAFIVTQPERIQGKNVVLIDDIFTTGTTVNECAKVLKCAGAKKIQVFCLSIAGGETPVAHQKEEV